MKFFAVLFCVLCMFGVAVAEQPFFVDDTKLAHDDVPGIAPWRTIALDADYGGQWLVAGDLDGDGVPEIVSAENHNVGDVHYTSAVVAQNSEGGSPVEVGETGYWPQDVAP
jgi:hypothetical protein